MAFCMFEVCGCRTALPRFLLEIRSVRVDPDQNVFQETDHARVRRKGRRRAGHAEPKLGAVDAFRYSDRCGVAVRATHRIALGEHA